MDVRVSRCSVCESGGRVRHDLPGRVLVLTPKAFGADGISALTRLVAASLSQRDVDVRVLALEADARRDLSDGDLNVPVDSAEGGRLRFLMHGVKAAPRGRRPELVIVTHLRMLPAAVPLMASGVPVVTFLLGVECWRPLTRRDRGLLARSHRLLPISRWTWQRFLQSNPSFREFPATVCPLGVETVALPDSAPIAGRTLAVGRLWVEERYKGHDLLIDVWPTVRQACAHARLIIAGDGDDRPRLQQRVLDGGLTGAVEFTGLISQADLRRQFSCAQLFALPSEGEGFGIVFLEAMRAARPCVAAAGAAEEIIANGVTGRIVPPKNAEALARVLIELLNDPPLCAALGVAGRNRCDAEFSTSRFAERLVDALVPACVTC
jgi:phosphatidylinositol alpha-1,6-mannosyltransferase